MSRGKQNTKSGWKARHKAYREQQKQRRRKNLWRGIVRHMAGWR